MYDQRVKKVREVLMEKKLDAFLVSNFFNIFYLTGFKTLTQDEREAFVLITKDGVYLFTDERYLQKNFQFPISNFQTSIKKQETNFQIRLIEPEKGLITHLLEITQKENIKSLGFEAEDIRFYEYQKLGEFLKNLRLTPTSRLVIRIREDKDKEEINYLQKACEIGDQCLSEISKIIRVGISEKEIAFKMEYWIRDKGYDPAFDPIVAVDANSSVAHYNTKDGNGIVKNNSIILIDFGVKYKNYLSDITRMFFLGKPSDEVYKVYKVLKEAQEKTVEKISELEFLKDLDSFCRKQITDYPTSLKLRGASQLPSYPHSTGHGVGLEIHEYPKVSFNSTDKKHANQVFTIEPGVYFPGKWGMRVEDTVVVGEDLKPIMLTNFSKELLIL